jgi:hypothetical protein
MVAAHRQKCTGSKMSKGTKPFEQLKAIQKKRAELQTKYARGGINQREQAVLDALQRQIDKKIRALSFIVDDPT